MTRLRVVVSGICIVVAGCVVSPPKCTTDADCSASAYCEHQVARWGLLSAWDFESRLGRRALQAQASAISSSGSSPSSGSTAGSSQGTETSGTSGPGGSLRFFARRQLQWDLDVQQRVEQRELLGHQFGKFLEQRPARWEQAQAHRSSGSATSSSSGSSSGSTGATDLPTISSFTASPNPIVPGGSATLTWAVADSDEVDLEPGVGAVLSDASVNVSPVVATTYTLTASNDGGSVQATVEVGVLPSILSFTVAPEAVDGGDSVLFSWNVSGAQALSPRPRDWARRERRSATRRRTLASTRSPRRTNLEAFSKARWLFARRSDQPKSIVAPRPPGLHSQRRGWRGRRSDLAIERALSEPQPLRLGSRFEQWRRRVHPRNELPAPRCRFRRADVHLACLECRRPQRRCVGEHLL